MAIEDRGFGPQLTADGDAVVRVDPGDGSVIRILPRTCRSGGHDQTGRYETRQYRRSSLIYMACTQCPPGGSHRETAWFLAVSDDVPAAVELDDAPYVELRRRVESGEIISTHEQLRQLKEQQRAEARRSEH